MSTRSNDREEERTDRRFRVTPATVIAGLALFVALGGTSIAATGLINGKQIKPGTVTAKQIRNRTITTAKLAPATVKGLRGRVGPTGATGQKGETGAAGVTGPAGPAALPAAFENESDQLAIPANAGAVDLAELSLPAGRYLITAKAVLKPAAPATTSCWVPADYGDFVDTSNWNANGPGEAGTLALTGITPSGTTHVSLRCFTEDVASMTGRNKLVAIPVAG
ncbi:MAG: hypothetical protein M9938_10305 [Solirubrobacterales bacterium]|nr:hypothetical protein [Solirubrobacterales bacterium]